MPRLPKFIRGGRIDYFGKKRIKKDVALFIEDLNFWLDKVFLYQKNKTAREAERFIRQLTDGINKELITVISDRVKDCQNCPKRNKAS
ncbi:MAG: hypothetical protein WCA08_18795 [Desulfoferrobacter sp.]